jgi:hypothetical protein
MASASQLSSRGDIVNGSGVGVHNDVTTIPNNAPPTVSSLSSNESGIGGSVCEVKDPLRSSPLTLLTLVRNDDVDGVRQWLDHYPSLVNIRGCYWVIGTPVVAATPPMQETALLAAVAVNGERVLEMIQLLISRGANVRASHQFAGNAPHAAIGTVLQRACTYSSAAVVSYLLESKASMDLHTLAACRRDRHTNADDECAPALWRAAKRGALDIVQVLLAARADLTFRPSHSHRFPHDTILAGAIMCPIADDRLVIMRRLLQLRPSLCNGDEGIAMYAALRTRHLPTIKLLLDSVFNHVFYAHYLTCPFILLLCGP